MEEAKFLTRGYRLTIAALLALLFHFSMFLIHFSWNSTAKIPPRVEIQTISSKKLEAIRQKQLLLNKESVQITENEPPDNARYFSDKNIRVKKEQRANLTHVIPKPGLGNTDPSNPTQSAKSAKNLSKLGIPFYFPAMTSPTSPSSQGGGDQAILDKTLPVGSENILNTEQFVYYSFYSRIYESIGPIWQSLIRSTSMRRSITPGDYTTVVDAVFDRDGNLIAIKQLQSSQIDSFDAAVESAWGKTNRFPNPPQALLNEKGEVHTGWTFTVQVGNGAGLELQEPRQRF